MYALVQLEHFLAERVLTALPELKRSARETGMRRNSYIAELDRCLDWSVQVQDARLYSTSTLPDPVAEQILAHVSRLHLMLQSKPGSHNLHEKDASPALERELRTLASEMGCALSQLQGMCLTHYPSKQLCSTRSAFELLLAIIDSSYSQDTDEHSPLRLLTSHALDTLMCTLVDASSETRGVFEQAKGLSLIRRVMNRHRRAPTDLDVTGAKCFEFLLFYLQAQVFEEQVGGQRTSKEEQPASVFEPPATPAMRARPTPTQTPFYTPMATPRGHVRVLSHGSPSKHTQAGRAPFGKLDTDVNPFSQDAQEGRRHLRTRSTDERRHLRTRSTDIPADLLRTPRAPPRQVRDFSPTRRMPRARETQEGQQPRYPTSPQKEGARSVAGLGVHTSDEPAEKRRW